MNAICFGWEPACSNRILAPGLPDEMMSANGLHVWLNPSGFWMWREDQVWLHPVTDVLDLVVGQQSSVLLTQTDGQFDLHSFCNETLTPQGVRHFTGRRIQFGAEIAVLDIGMERVVHDVRTGDRIQVPVGARDNHPQAWLVGRGITWVDQCHIYSMSLGGRPRVVGRLPAEPTEWRVGPQGTALFVCDGITITLHHSGVMHEFPQIDLTPVRFRLDGNQMLSVWSNGAAYIDLKDGNLIEERSGTLLPVGFDTKPIVLDEDAGIIKWFGGSSICDGFSPSAASIFEHTLYGPGGTAWDLSGQQRLWRDAPLAGVFMIAHSEGVIEIDERIVGYSKLGQKVLDVPLPLDESMDGEILDVRWVDGVLEFEMTEDTVLVDLQGQRMAPTVSRGPSLAEVQTSPTPTEIERGSSTSQILLEMDGSLHTEGADWLWNDDGMLVVINH